MGCDIHMHYEVKKDGRWEYINWRDTLPKDKEDDDVYYKALFDHPLYIHRNYDLFSILANVRNGYGFAGCDTSTGFIPISMPRGIPDDATETVEKECEERGVDGHSHSYLLLKEVLNCNWSLVVNIIGIVNKREYKVFKENGKPNSWCGGISGPKMEMVTSEKMEELIKSKEETQKFHYTRVIWQQTYREAVGEHWFKTLKELQKYGDINDVRLVFWFDN